MSKIKNWFRQADNATVTFIIKLLCKSLVKLVLMYNNCKPGVLYSIARFETEEVLIACLKN